MLALRALSHDFVNQASKPDVPRLAIEPLMPELPDFHGLESQWTCGDFETQFLGHNNSLKCGNRRQDLCAFRYKAGCNETGNP